MIIGCPKEIKKHEYRAGLTPHCASAYVRHGHTVLVQRGAGSGSGFEDQEYSDAGAKLVDSSREIWAADMVVKVKEPLPEEFQYFRENLILYTYLHLAAAEELTRALLNSGVKGIAYETIQTDDGHLPCLTPMSEIAGRLSVQEGAKYLEKTFGGRGVLLGGVPGVERGKVAILGGGVVGLNACKIAVGMGAEVTLLDINTARLAYLDDIFQARITTLVSNERNIEKIARESDVIIGAVLIPGAKAPRLIRREHLKLMKKGAVLVDVAVDQGGCFETTRATFHDDPVYLVDDVIHYCVANMPGAVARTATLALTNATLNHGLNLADNGVEKACRESVPLQRGLNIYTGKCTHRGVAEAFGLDYTNPETAL
ncbi:alanine dehydrogenase [Marispirochaeta sp.]|jgi:alanine dehydrogenase|uniref:alanine dehydrogenase n=1 Tax=Marispirochaeta sp. TaxID=2038653 RepID=UPI0029C86243|nr:alanine dehydrogenase [Marispirochaeta sp.]